MPTYGYKCTECADTFEILQKITEDALTTCEKCGGRLKKLIYPVGIAFKGEGFYVTDYKGAGKDPKPVSTEVKAEGTTPETKSEATKTESVAEAKTATKPEAKAETSAAPVATETKPSPPNKGS
jgi:putative FmdB family regulatory protein